MQAVDDPLDDHPRDELEIPDAREHNGIDEAGGGGRLERSHVSCQLRVASGERLFTSYSPHVTRHSPLHTGARYRYGLEQFVDHRVGRHALRLGVEVHEHTVT